MARPRLIYTFRDLSPTADLTFGTSEAATPLGTFILPAQSLVSGAAVDLQLQVYLGIPSGTATIRIRDGHPQTGTILLTMAVTTPNVAVSSAVVSLAASGVPRLLYLTGQGTVAANSIKLATLIVSGDADSTAIFDYKRFGRGLDPV